MTFFTSPGFHPTRFLATQTAIVKVENHFDIAPSCYLDLPPLTYIHTLLDWLYLLPSFTM